MQSVAPFPVDSVPWESVLDISSEIRNNKHKYA